MFLSLAASCLAADIYIERCGFAKYCCYKTDKTNDICNKEECVFIEQQGVVAEILVVV